MNDELLEAALQALRDGDRGGALRALLEAWRADRSPQLAEALTWVGNEAGRALPPIAGKTRAAFHEHWLDVATARRPVDLPRLIEGLRHPPWTRFRERLDRLVGFEDDPRVAIGLAQFVEDLPVLSSIDHSGWRTVLGLIARIADARCRSRLERRFALESGTSLVENETIRPGIAALLEALPERAEAQLPILTEIAAAVEALSLGPPATAAQLIHSKPGEVDEPRLLAAIYAAPTEDPPRLVYADWLLERGDPRGAFIAMQFESLHKRVTQAQLKREKAALKDHQRLWLGPLEPVVIRETVRFEKGFLAAVAPHFHTAKQLEELGDHPAWGTVSTLEAGGDPQPLLARSALLGLRKLEVPIDHRQLALMATRPRPYPRLEHLRLHTAGVPGPHLLEQITHGPALPKLQILEVAPAGDDALQWLVGAPLGDRLRRLEIDDSGPTLNRWLALGKALPSIERVEVGRYPHFALVKDPAGWSLEISFLDNPAQAWMAIERLGEVKRITLVARTADGQLEERVRARLTAYEVEIRRPRR